MIEAKDVTSFELGKSLPKNLFLWPKYLWINDPSQKQATILRSKSCHDCPFDAYPALTRKEIKKRIEKFISTMPDASGKYAVGRLLKKAGLLPLSMSPLETEIMELHLQGKMISAIQKWLTTEKKISIAYSNLYNFIHRRAEKYSATSGTSVILHFMRLKPEVREEVLQILLMLMHKDIPNQRSLKKEGAAAQEPKIYSVPADYLSIQEEDAPGIKKLKRLASLDSTQLENLPDDLKPGN